MIELLEGKPPYHFLDPMPALFRIVQDDNPPIPEGASPVVKDFLYHCFQKDCNLRVSAKKLLKHPWMQSARKQMVAHGQSQTNLGTDNTRGENGRPLSNYNYDEAEEALQDEPMIVDDDVMEVEEDELQADDAMDIDQTA